MDLTETGYECVHWMQLTHDRVRRTLVTTVIKL